MIKIGEGDIEIGGEEYVGIRDAEIRINKDEDIEYAKFVSSDGGEYVFNYGGREYLFNARAKGKIVFDPNSRVVSGEGTENYFHKTITPLLCSKTS